jgi:hypothetical protein
MTNAGMEAYGRCKLAQTLWKSVWSFLKKPKRTTLWSYCNTPGHVLGYKRDTCTPMFIAALLTIDKIWK